MAAVMPWHHNYYPCLLPGSLIAPIGRWDRSTAALSLSVEYRRPPSRWASDNGRIPRSSVWNAMENSRSRIRRVKIGPQEKEGFINRRSLRFSFLFFFLFSVFRATKEEINLTSLLPVGSTEWKDRSGRNREENRARVPRDFCFRLPSRGNIYKRRCLLLVFSRDYRK